MLLARTAVQPVLVERRLYSILLVHEVNLLKDVYALRMVTLKVSSRCFTYKPASVLV